MGQELPDELRKETPDGYKIWAKERKQRKTVTWQTASQKELTWQEAEKILCD